MPTSDFMPGQRWVSNTEPELGLGIVSEINDRHITFSFPASGEQRVYAANNSPLTRLHYHPGDQIVDNDDHSYTVTDILEANGCLIYNCLDQDAEAVTIHEIELNSFVQFSNPKDRLFAGQIDKPSSYQLRIETLKHFQRLQHSQTSGLLGARIEKLPHQLYIAQEVANRHAPRVLLADEVGLGKTIEAGLIIHQQLHTSRAKRVLICLPDSLVHQWLVEMLRRFNLHFSILDTQRCLDLSEAPEELNEFDERIQGETLNPFEQAQLVICPLSLFTQSEQRLDEAVTAGWDLLVVDEAHHLEWNLETPSIEYQCVETLSAVAKGLLLLTATPEQLGIESHFARLRLLDPDRYHDLSAFIEEEKRYQPVNALIQEMRSDNPCKALQTPENKQALIEFLGEDETDKLISTLSSDSTSDHGVAIQAALQQLLDCHGTGRVLFRNTRANISGFPERQLIPHPLPAPAIFTETTQPPCDDWQSLKQRLQPESILGDDWIETDPRIEWLVQQLKTLKKNKALVICHKASTAMALEEHLRLRQGIRCADFHEGMSLLERDRAAAYFADQELGAQVLICSEIGSEGRNFQFSHHLIMWDLPLNPDLLEQRIGRLDRIGQQHTVKIHIPHYENSEQARLLEWYHQGINAIESPCPAGQNLWQTYSDSLLENISTSDDNGKAWQDLVTSTHQSAQSLMAELQAGRDQLLELNSCNNEDASKIIENLTQEENSDELSIFMEAVFNEYNIDQEHHSEHSIVVRPSEHMACHHFPGLSEEGLTATFDRSIALGREDMHYLTWEHPMVTGAMEMILSGEHGNTQLCTLKLRPLKPGTLLLETTFTLSCPAPKELQLPRYLDTSTQRILLDSNGNDLGHVVSAAHLDNLGERVHKGTGRELIKHARDQINALVKQAEEIAQKHQKQAIENATEKMQNELQKEKQRLVTLSQSNPNIRQDEINYLGHAATQLETYLGNARFTLNAIRVAIVT